MAGPLRPGRFFVCSGTGLDAMPVFGKLMLML